jgi:FlaA1/EpsC-like NDP-sugar epimerase
VHVVGARPGEKLEEELIGMDEPTEPTGHPSIARISPALPDAAELRNLVARLSTLAMELRDQDVRDALLRAAQLHGDGGEATGAGRRATTDIEPPAPGQ